VYIIRPFAVFVKSFWWLTTTTINSIIKIVHFQGEHYGP
jgi:hypothetical protein